MAHSHTSSSLCWDRHRIDGKRHSCILLAPLFFFMRRFPLDFVYFHFLHLQFLFFYFIFGTFLNISEQHVFCHAVYLRFTFYLLLFAVSAPQCSLHSFWFYFYFFLRLIRDIRKKKIDSLHRLHRIHYICFYPCVHVFSV